MIDCTSFYVSSGQFPMWYIQVFFSHHKYLVSVVDHNSSDAQVGVSVRWNVTWLVVFWQPFIHHHESFTSMMEVETTLKSWAKQCYNVPSWLISMLSDLLTLANSGTQSLSFTLILNHIPRRPAVVHAARDSTNFNWIIIYVLFRTRNFYVFFWPKLLLKNQFVLICNISSHIY